MRKTVLKRVFCTYIKIKMHTNFSKLIKLKNTLKISKTKYTKNVHYTLKKVQTIQNKNSTFELVNVLTVYVVLKSLKNNFKKIQNIYKNLVLIFFFLNEHFTNT